MNHFIIKPPTRLVLAAHIFGLGWEKLVMPDGSECVIDMSRYTYGEPQGMILFALVCRIIISRHPRVAFKLKTSNNHFKGYASHVGLFKFMGFELGNDPTQRLDQGLILQSEYLTSPKLRSLQEKFQSESISQNIL